MAIRTFNSVGGFSVGEVPVQVIDNTGNIANVDKAVISNVTVSTKLVAGNITSNNLSNTRVAFTKDSVLSDSANLTFTGGNVFTIKDAANITDGTNYISITGTDGGIKSTGNANLANGAFTVTTAGDAAIANSLTVGYNSADGDSAFYVDAEGNFSIKVANAAANGGAGGFDTVFSVDAASGNITTAGSVVSPTGGAATIQAPGANTEILFNDASNVGASSLFTFDKTAQALSIDGNIQLLSDTGTGYLVLPQGGYVYDGGIVSSAILHADGVGAAQLEYGSATYVYANSSGAYLSANADSSNVQVLDAGGVTLNAGSASVKVVDGANVTITSGGKDWDFKTDGNLSAPGSIWANAGNFELSGYANIGSTLNVVGVANLLSDVGIEGTLNVTATTNLFDAVTIGTAIASANLDVYGNLHVYEDANIDGALTIGNLHVTNYVTSNLIPSDDVTYDLGSDGHRWKDLWLSGLTINLGNTTISSGGSNTMIVSNAVVGFPGTYGSVVVPLGDLKAGNLVTAGFANIGNTGTRANLFVSGNAAIDETSVSTSTTTGAFTVKGGVGIGGNIYIGGATANIDGNLLIGNATTNASANITGNVRIGGNANIISDLVVGGNLTVSGTTTYVNTTNSSITDALIDIGGAAGGADLSGADLFDRGLFIHNYTGSAVVNQFMGWKQGDSEFQLKSGVTSTGNEISDGAYANVRVDHMFGTVGTTTQDEITDMGGLVNIAVSGNANVTGTANIATAIVTTSLTIGELAFPLLDYSTTINSNETIALTTDGAGTLDFAVIKTDRISNVDSRVLVNEANVVVTANSTVMFKATEFGANIYGTFGVQGLLTAGSLNVGTLTPQSIAIGDTKIDDSTVTTPDDQQAPIAEVPAVAGNAVEFFVKGISELGGVKYVTVATVTALYDGTNVDFATYGKLHMPSGGTGAGSLTVNYGGGNIQLLATPTQNASTVWTAQIRTI